MRAFLAWWICYKRPWNARAGWLNAVDEASDYRCPCGRCDLPVIEREVVTHGRHCPCSACEREDWTRPDLAPCGMHGPDCPAVYAPVTS